MKKRIIILSAVLLCVLAISVVIIMQLGTKKESKMLTQSEKVKNYVISKKTTTYYIIGHDVEFSDGVHKQYLEKIDKEIIDNTEDEYKEVVINDLYDDVELSDEDIEYLKNLLESEKVFVMYIGRKYGDNKDNLSYVFYRYNGQIVTQTGDCHASYEDSLKNQEGFLEDIIIGSVMPLYKLMEQV